MALCGLPPAAGLAPSAAATGAAARAATAATRAAAEATAAARAAAAAALLRFVDTNAAAFELGAVHLFDGTLNGIRLGEGDETETTGTSRVSIGDDACVDDLTETLKPGLQ